MTLLPKSKSKLKRVYHDYRNWEEVKFNMWGEIADREKALAKAIRFTKNHLRYGHFMRRVTKEWPISCENALTDSRISKRAWVGHAAVALALRIPEDITRAAWAHLSDEQQLLANGEAERAISKWTISYCKNKALYKDLGAKMLSRRNSGRSAEKAYGLASRAILQSNRDMYSKQRSSTHRSRV